MGLPFDNDSYLSIIIIIINSAMSGWERNEAFILLGEPIPVHGGV